jgi:hypothetical protein
MFVFIICGASILLALASTVCADPPPATQPATQPAAPLAGVEFLDGDAARAALIDDSIDPYFSRLEPHEMTAKTGSPITGDTREAQIAECKKRYQAAVVDFTEDEKQLLSFFISKAQAALRRDYPVFGNTPWSIIKTSASLEGGMAYTRGGHIILPENVLARFSLFRKRLKDRSLPIGASLLIHEQTHVLERLHPELFTSLFTGTFHFVHAGKIEPNAWLTDRQLINPDGPVADWVFPLTEDGKDSFILPLIAFDDPNPTSLTHGISMIAVTMEPTKDGFKATLGTDGNPIVRSLADVAAYMQGPGAEQNNYHPNEIIADRFAEVIVFDDLMDPATKAQLAGASADKLEGRLKPIRDWAKTAFASPAK